MYKIYKSQYKLKSYNTNYFLYNENMVIIKWFYVIENIYVSGIFDIDNTNKLNKTSTKLNFPKECIYESSALPEAIDQLEQMWILSHV